MMDDPFKISPDSKLRNILYTNLTNQSWLTSLLQISRSKVNLIRIENKLRKVGIKFKAQNQRAKQARQVRQQQSELFLKRVKMQLSRSKVNKAMKIKSFSLSINRSIAIFDLYPIKKNFKEVEFDSIVPSRLSSSLKHNRSCSDAQSIVWQASSKYQHFKNILKRMKK